MEQYADVTNGNDDCVTDHEEVVYDPIIPLFRQWTLLKDDVEEANRELASLRDQCIAAIEARGERDHRGSQWIKLPFPIGNKGFTSIKRERRISHQTDEEVAEAITRSKDCYEVCFPLRRILDQEELYVQYQKGVLSQEDMDMIFTQVESWSFRPTA